MQYLPQPIQSGRLDGCVRGFFMTGFVVLLGSKSISGRGCAQGAARSTMTGITMSGSTIAGSITGSEILTESRLDRVRLRSTSISSIS